MKEKGESSRPRFDRHKESDEDEGDDLLSVYQDSRDPNDYDEATWP